MIEVRIPKEIREYKEKLFFGLNLRQTITTTLAIVICVPLYIMGKKYINQEVLSWLTLAVAMPLVLIGYFNFNQMTFENFVVAWFKMQWNPQKRPFRYEPIFMTIRKEIITEDIKQQKIELKAKGLKKGNKKKADTEDNSNLNKRG